MNPSSGIWPGKKITPSRKILRGEDALTVRQVCNGILNSKVLRNQAGSNKFSITPENAVFEVSDRAISEDTFPFFFPFKLYQFPRELRIHPNSDDWRRLKIRNGIIHTEDNIASGADSQSWTLYGADDSANLFSASYPQTPPADASSVVVGLWNEAVIPDDGDEYHIWFSFLDGTNNSGGVTWSYGLFYGKTFGTDGTDGTAVQLYDGNNCTPISYRGSSDLYNRKIGSAHTSGGVLIIQQEIFQHPLVLRNPTQPGLGRWRGAYDINHHYYVGDLVYLDDSGSSSHDFRTVWIYYPPSSASAYYPVALMGPMTGVSPIGHSPDPWFRVSRSPIATSGTDPAWTSGAYDASKFYIRSS